jgi:general secretion pathway protein K
LPVLRSINSDDDLSPLSEAEAETLWQQRDESGFENLEGFLANPVFEGKKIGKIAPLLGESSNYFRMSARVEIAGRELQLYSVLRRAERRIESIVRASGSL